MDLATHTIKELIGAMWLEACGRPLPECGALLSFKRSLTGEHLTGRVNGLSWSLNMHTGQVGYYVTVIVEDGKSNYIWGVEPKDVA